MMNPTPMHQVFGGDNGELTQLFGRQRNVFHTPTYTMHRNSEDIPMRVRATAGWIVLLDIQPIEGNGGKLRQDSPDA